MDNREQAMAQAKLLWKTGEYTNKKIAQEVGVYKSTIKRWIKKFKEESISNSITDSVKECACTTTQSIENPLTVEEIEGLRELLRVKSKLINSMSNSNNNSDSNTYDDIKARTLFISEKVFKQFKSYAKEKDLLLKEIVTQALYEFMEKHK